MCGVFGTFMKDDDVEVERGLDLLTHRGPDGRGLTRAGEAIHGHVRLALVDLSSASAQPFRVAGGTLSWVGELWNHAELRVELRSLGCPFRTTGDTEVLAAALRRWGEAALPRLDGMFAGAWSSSTADLLFHDRYGKIPMYVIRKGRTFEWSSERKAWGHRGGLAAPLPPGSTLNLRTGELRTWYALPSGVEAVDEAGLIDLLRGGVRKRLAADAPTCVLVSGGLDSSLILALAVEVRPDVAAFTAKLDADAVDLRESRRLCANLGVRLTEVQVNRPTPASLAAACRAIEVASKAQCEIAAMCLPLARRIAADGFKACLSGEAADELFGGYGNSIIKAAGLDDRGWIEHRRFLLAKMARGNFVRCNKAFMAAGVECRLPFMERGLVESVLLMGKAECPPGKGLLKRASVGLVPRVIINRAKETFQGGSGMARAAAEAVHDPLHFCHAEIRRTFGRCVMD